MTSPTWRALQRGRARAEKRICDLKDTGLANLPSASFAINHAWMTLCPGRHDLQAWTRLVVLVGDPARAEPKRLRYCLLHCAALLTRSGRRLRLRLAVGWPWATELVMAFRRVRQLRLQT